MLNNDAFYSIAHYSIAHGGGPVKKFGLIIFISIACSFFIFAGDVAEYYDLGFSPDGKYFAFAEYGVNDNSFLPFATIYTVNIEKNEFVRGGVFKSVSTNPKEVKGGKALFDELYAKNKDFLERYSGNKANLEHTLYLRGPESKLSSEQIVFKDFNNSSDEKEIFYYINLVQNSTGKGKNLKSSFFITVERKDENDNVISRQIAGNPDYQRDLVSDYAIRRIITNESGNSLIFEVEKRIENENGTSFRYMVETLVLE